MSSTKKAFRKLVACMSVIAMLFTCSVSAYAATGTPSAEPYSGTENWGSTTNKYVGSMHMTDCNLTPVKTITTSGTLHIWGHFYGEDDWAAYSPIKFTAELRVAYGSALQTHTYVDQRNGLQHFSLDYPVRAGDKIQLFFDASSISNPPGYYRQAFVEYWYYITP